MTPDEITSFLHTYNKWRRGDETIEQPNPKQIGETIKIAADLIEELAHWKAEAMQVMGEMDVQAVGRLLELPLGTSVYPAVEPGIRALKEKLDNLPEKLSNALWECSALRNGLLRPSELKPFMKNVIKQTLETQ